MTIDPGRHIPCHYHAIPNTYCLLPWGQTAGMALRWFRDVIYAPGQDFQNNGDMLYRQMTVQAATVPPGSTGLIFLPHLEGAACPEFNPAAKGVFFGLTLRHTQAHMIRAVMESVSYMLKNNLDLVSRMGVPINEIRSMGGGAKSDLWLQMKADVLQKPVQRVNTEEAACLGATILASVCTGDYGNIVEAVNNMVKPGQTFFPDPAKERVYQEGYEKYRKLYDQLEPLFTI
jgi:xylulokinase